MDWLRSLAGGGSAASQASVFPFDVKEGAGNSKQLRVGAFSQLAEASRKDSAGASIVAVLGATESAGSEQAVSCFLSKQGGVLAQASLKRLKTLRHPNILALLGSLELDSNGGMIERAIAAGPPSSMSSSQNQVVAHVIKAAVPHVRTLREALERAGDDVSPASLPWGIYQVAQALAFLHKGNLGHFSLCTDAVFVDDAGDWKLGCLELVSGTTDAQSTLRQFHAQSVPQRTSSLEVAKANWEAVEQGPVHASDSWSLAALIWECYNRRDLTGLADLKSTGAIPEGLLRGYKALLAASPSARMSPQEFSELEFFQEDHFVTTYKFLDEIALKENFEKDKFFRQLEKSLDDNEFPDNACRRKILPKLVQALDFTGASSSVLGPLLKIARLITPAEFKAQISPSVVKWFASPDRALRTQLLTNLDGFIVHFSDKVVDAELFPHICTGFLDTSPALREITVKSMLVIVPKLTERTINTQLLKHFARLQMDPEAALRTNTTICLAKLATHLSRATRDKVLVPAFSRALRDPDSRARVAGLMSFIAVLEFLTPADIARRVMPVVSPLMIDTELSVRQRAFEAVDACLVNLRKSSETMPKSGRPEEVVGATATGGFGSAPATPTQPSGSSGWMSSILSSTATGSGGPGTSTTQPQGHSAAPAPKPSNSQGGSARSASAASINGSRPVVSHQNQVEKSSVSVAAQATSSGGWDDIDAGTGWEDGGDAAGGWEDANTNDWGQKNPSKSSGVLASGWGSKASEALREEDPADDWGAGKGGGGGWDDGDDFDFDDFDVKPKEGKLTKLEARQQHTPQRRSGKKE